MWWSAVIEMLHQCTYASFGLDRRILLVTIHDTLLRLAQHLAEVLSEVAVREQPGAWQRICVRAFGSVCAGLSPGQHPSAQASQQERHKALHPRHPRLHRGCVLSRYLHANV
jgi:hypothetical protein